MLIKDLYHEHMADRGVSITPRQSLRWTNNDNSIRFNYVRPREDERVPVFFSLSSGKTNAILQIQIEPLS